METQGLKDEALNIKGKSRQLEEKKEELDVEMDTGDPADIQVSQIPEIINNSEKVDVSAEESDSGEKGYNQNSSDESDEKEGYYYD
ncbi:hypothetical protein VKT23_017324 [Stygiomarasmius scandens]|uniref:Uncharacterized protein n=1 Tax=Marasmiellus scandens TaxID=2682957 RepID=A0ABR1IWT0_9AGAR